MKNNNHKPHILIVDDDRIILESLRDFLRSRGYAVSGASTFTEGINKLRKEPFNLVITDMTLPDGHGMDMLDVIKKDYPQTVSLVITAYGTIESAVEAIKKGAYDYLTKPVIDDELLMAVERAIKQQSLLIENQRLRTELKNRYSLDNVISQDYKMARIFELIEAVADSSTTVLMTGDSGTGKSMIARAIHHRSQRRDKPFIEVSCGALPESLLETELFGHVRGSFTGAVSDKQGKFLAADGGTIFLDEIATASPAMQVKLLRVLQDRHFEPVGSNQTISVNTRVILATNKDLSRLVQSGEFREDLYYRVNVVNINLPRLRDRIGDLGILIEHFIKRFNRVHNRNKTGISDRAMEALRHYSWPGNVRELENIIERAVLLSKQPVIDIADLPGNLTAGPGEDNSEKFRAHSLKQALQGPEKNIIRNALEANGFNRQATADALKINRTTLYKKMKRYGLEDEAVSLGI